MKLQHFLSQFWLIPSLSQRGSFKPPAKAVWTNRRLIPLTLTCLLVTSLALPLLTLLPGFPLNQVQAANWYNEDWPYRKRIELVSDSTQSNTYHQLTLDTSDASKFNTGCSDLRFTDSQGQLIPHHLVSGCGTTNTQVQLLFAEISPDPQDIYVYYGNKQSSQSSTNQPFNNPATDVTTTIKSEESSTGPIAHWKFDEGYGSILHDSTTNQNHGTIHGATWQGEDTCPSGKCLYFDGVDDYARVPYHQSLSAKNFTVSFWFKVSTIDNKAGCCASIFSMSEGANNRNYEVYIRRDNGVLATATSFSGLQRDISIDTRVDDNKWRHFSYSVYGGITDIYLNGRLVRHYEGSGTADTQETSLAFSPSGAIQGFIDDPKIYNYPRTQQQIQQDYLQGLESLQRQQANLSNGLVGHWKMDEPSWNGTASEVKDDSGNNHHGAAASGVSVAAGKYGNGAEFDAASGRIDVPHSDQLNITGSFSISMWIKPNNTTSQAGLIVKRTLNVTSPWSLEYRFGSLYFGRYGTDSLWHTYQSTQSIQSNKWQHIIVVGSIESGNLAMYVDGQKISISHISPTNGQLIEGVNDNLQNVVIGYDQAYGYFDGSIDEVRLYDRPLNEGEIINLNKYAPKPVAYYDFEEGSGDTVFNKSGNSFDGTWNGSGQHYGQGKIGRSGVFNNQGQTNDYVNLGSTLTVRRSVTLSAWVYLSGDDPAIGTEEIVGNSQGVRLTYSYNPYPSTMVVQAFIDSSGWTPTYRSTANVAVAKKQWIHIAGVRDMDAGTLSLYINGAEVSKTSGIPDGLLNMHGWNIGKRDSSTKFKGQIDEVKIYNYARTQQQIIEDMTAGQPAVNTPIGHWKFDEGQGSTAYNSGIATTSGTISNCSWITTSNQNQGIDCAGGSGGVSLGNNPAYASADLTISTWIKLGELNDTPAQANDNIIMGKESYTNNGFRYGVDRDGRPQFWTTQSGGDLNIHPSNPINDQEWHHLVVSYNNQMLQAIMYIDGKQVAVKSGAYIPNTTSSLVLNGGVGGTKRSNSAFDELKLYNYALTPQDILIDYNQSSATVAGHTSTQPTTTDSGNPTSKPSNSTASKYCVPGSPDHCAPPVAEYDFEEGEGSVVKDVSGNGNDGEWHGSSSQRYAMGRQGKAAVLDGVSSYVDFGKKDAFDIVKGSESAGTIEFWVKSQESEGTKSIIDTKTAGSNSPGYDIIMVDGRLQARVANGLTQKGALSNKAIANNEWHHVTIILDRPNSRLNIYIDGVLDKEFDLELDGSFSISTNLRIGSYGGAVFFAGSIDQVRIYNYARTPAQVAWDYNQGKPIAHYKFNECSGTTIHDSSTNALHGSLYLGSAGITTPGTCHSTGAWSLGKDGRLSSGMSFDGLDDHIRINPAASLNPGSSDFTLAFWQRRLSTGAVQIIVGKRTYPLGYALYYQNDNLVMQFGNGSTVTTFPLGINKELDTWQHIVVSVNRQDETINYYLDGQLIKTVSTASFSGSLSNTGYFGIGRDQSDASAPYKGYLDDIQIFNYALTDQQVQTLHNNGAVRWEPQP